MFPPISNFISSYHDIQDFLIQQSQITMTTDINNHFKKILLLSCASYYEKEIQDSIKKLTKTKTTDDRIFNFISNKAISRQYHTYFDWSSKNINSFLGLFGDEFKTKVTAEINSNDDLVKGMKAFLTIGNERNKMVHENFLIYNLESTFDEIVELNNQATNFINYITNKITEI